MTDIRVVVADDHPVVRDGLAALLRSLPGFDVVAVAAGEAIFGPGVAQRVLRYFATPLPAEGPFPELTNREREIPDLLAAGLPNGTIAQRLGLAAKTVANNISAIFTKLQVADRAQAIVRARDAGLGRG